MNKTILLLALLLALGACGDSGGDGRTDLDAARSEVSDAVPGITSLLTGAIGEGGDSETDAQVGAPKAAYGTCGTAPTWALRYEEIVAWGGEASVAELDLAAAALEAEGWSKESERALRNDVAASTWTRDGLKTSLMLRRGELAWAVSGECVRVDEDLANDLVGPID